MTTKSITGKVTLLLLIHGRVQGVAFRYSMRREAERSGITGWVRNRSDGTVEAAVHGEPAAVDLIVRWAHHGPRHAQVTQVDVTPDDRSYNSFDVIE